MGPHPTAYHHRRSPSLRPPSKLKREKWPHLQVPKHPDEYCARPAPGGPCGWVAAGPQCAALRPPTQHPIRGYGIKGAPGLVLHSQPATQRVLNMHPSFKAIFTKYDISPKTLWISAVFWCGSPELLGWRGLAGGLPLVCTADPLMGPL